MKEDFELSLANVLESEGGFSNDPHDPGGATMNGVVQSEYDRYRTRHDLPHRSVRYISLAERDEIYRAEYWDAVNGDTLPAGLDYCVFDFGVNSGVSRALRYLHALDNGVNGEAEIDAYCDARLEFLKGLHTWRYFGKGWGARVAKVRKIAKQMLAGSPLHTAEA